jgi:peptide/nickel transport system permease protein
VISIGRFVGVRVMLGLLTLLLLSIVTFVATNVVPVDPARVALGRYATQEQVVVYRHEQGLDKPPVTRYVRWLDQFVQGNWGTSTTSQRSVASDVVPRIARTATLGGVAMLLAIPLAFVIGIYTGQRAGRRSEVGISLVTLLLNSMPEFVVGFILLVIFGVHFGVLPIESSGASYGSGWTEVEAYVLPVLTLVLLLTPYMTRMIRANVRDVQAQPYVRSALLRGVSPGRLAWRHIAPNASLPVVNVIALTLADLIGGVVVVETVFGFPGVGQLLVQSVTGKDIPTVQTLTLLIGAGFVVLNFVADGVVLLLNPRLRRA